MLVYKLGYLSTSLSSQVRCLSTNWVIYLGFSALSIALCPSSLVFGPVCETNKGLVAAVLIVSWSSPELWAFCGRFLFADDRVCLRDMLCKIPILRQWSWFDVNVCSLQTCQWLWWSAVGMKTVFVEMKNFKRKSDNNKNRKKKLDSCDTRIECWMSLMGWFWKHKVLSFLNSYFFLRTLCEQLPPPPPLPHSHSSLMCIDGVQ